MKISNPQFEYTPLDLECLAYSKDPMLVAFRIEVDLCGLAGNHQETMAVIKEAEEYKKQTYPLLHEFYKSL